MARAMGGADLKGAQKCLAKIKFCDLHLLKPLFLRPIQPFALSCANTAPIAYLSIKSGVWHQHHQAL